MTCSIFALFSLLVFCSLVTCRAPPPVEPLIYVGIVFLQCPPQATQCEAEQKAQEYAIQVGLDWANIEKLKFEWNKGIIQYNAFRKLHPKWDEVIQLRLRKSHARDDRQAQSRRAALIGDPEVHAIIEPSTSLTQPLETSKPVFYTHADHADITSKSNTSFRLTQPSLLNCQAMLNYLYARHVFSVAFVFDSTLPPHILSDCHSIISSNQMTAYNITLSNDPASHHSAADTISSLPVVSQSNPCRCAPD